MWNAKRELNNYIHTINSHAGWEQAYLGKLDRKLTVKEWSLGISGFILGILATFIFMGQFVVHMLMPDASYIMLLNLTFVISVVCFVLYIISYKIINANMGSEESSRSSAFFLDVISVFHGLNTFILVLVIIVYIVMGIT